MNPTSLRRGFIGWLLLPVLLSAQPASPPHEATPPWLTEARQKIRAIVDEVTRDDALMKAEIAAVNSDEPRPAVRAAVQAMGATPAELNETKDNYTRADLRIDQPGSNFWAFTLDQLSWLMVDPPEQDQANYPPPNETRPSLERVQHFVATAEADLTEWRALRRRERTALAALDRAARSAEVLSWFSEVVSERNSGAKHTRAGMWAMRDAMDAATGAHWEKSVYRNRFNTIAGRPVFFLTLFWAEYPPARVATWDGERLARAAMLDSVEVLETRLTDLQLSVLELLGRPGRAPFSEVAGVLSYGVGSLRNWRVGFEGAIDGDARELAVLTAATTATLREAEALLEPVRKVAEENLRSRGLEPAQEARKLAAENADAEVAARANAGDNGGAAIKRAERDKINGERKAIEEENQQRAGAAESTFEASLAAAMTRVHSAWPQPAERRVTAVILEPRREIQGVPWNVGVGLFRPSFQMMAAGVPISAIVRYELSLPSEIEKVKVTLGDRSATVVENRSLPDLVGGPGPDTEFVVASAAADHTLSASPTSESRPPPPPPGLFTVDRAAPRPLAGTWQVAYFDARLGWVRGKVRVAVGGSGAEMTLYHPQTSEKMILVAPAPRSEGEHLFSFDFHGPSPGPVPGMPENYVIGEDGGVLPRPGATVEKATLSLGATPPLPAGLPRLIAPVGKTALKVETGEFHGQLALPSLVAPEAESVLTLHLRWWQAGDGSAPAHNWRTKLGPIIPENVEVNEWLAGRWEVPVDPSTRQPADVTGRTLLLQRDPGDPAHVVATGEEIWWREPEKAKLQLIAQTAVGPEVVRRFFLGVPTVVEAIYDQPQEDDEKPLELVVEGRKQTVTMHRDEQDRARFLSDPILAGDRPAPAARRTP